MKEFIDKNILDEVKAGTNIISGDEYRQMFYAVSQVASDMVVKTLGPNGQTTLLDDGTFAYPTKDGYNVINRLMFNDPVQNTLFKTLKQISFSIASKVGDGTTTALVGANAFLKRLIEYQQIHTVRQADLVNTIEEVKNSIVNNLLSGEELGTIDMDGDFTDIFKIAQVSSNHNTKLASIIQQIYQITKNPNIYVTLDGGNEMEFEIQTGYKFDCKVLNHKAYINEDNGTCKKALPTLVAIFDHNVSYNEHGQIITMLSRYAQAKNTELVVIAPYFDDIITNIIGTTINSYLQQGQVPNIMMIQVPLSMEIHRQYLSDIVLLTNAQVFDYGKVRACSVMMHNQSCPPEEKIEDTLLNIDQYNFNTPEELIASCIGTALNLTIAEKYAIIQEYDNVVNRDLLKNTVAEAKQRYHDTKEKAQKSTTVLNKDFMDAYQRYTKLVGNMGIIRVGGASDIEKHCMKDAVDDAVLACKSACDNGFVTGLNISLLRTISNLGDEYRISKASSLKCDICDMFLNTFKEVSMCVLQNKYPDNSEVRQVPVANDSSSNPIFYSNIAIIEFCIRSKCGYNLITNEFEDSKSSNVINSVSTDVEILNMISSILSLMLTSNQFVSANRGYNRQVSKQQAIDESIQLKVDTAKAVVNALIENGGIAALLK